MFEFDESIDQSAKIKVIGVGGGGGNAVNTMIDCELHGIDFIVANTDAQALRMSKAPVKIQIGSQLTKGLGAGAEPSVGKDAAAENREQLAEVLSGADMVFIAAGLGGGTGTGAAPVIADVAKGNGRPDRRCRDQALYPGRQAAPCQGGSGCPRAEKTRRFAGHPSPMTGSSALPENPCRSVDAFKPSDDVLRQAVQGISDLITTSGLINVDFADVKAIMSRTGHGHDGHRPGQRREQGGSTQRSRPSPARSWRISTFQAPRACWSTSPVPRP